MDAYKMKPEVTMTDEQFRKARRGLGAFDALVDRVTMLRLVIKDNSDPDMKGEAERRFYLATIPVLMQAIKDMHDFAVPMHDAVEACVGLFDLPEPPAAPASKLN